MTPQQMPDNVLEHFSRPKREILYMLSPHRHMTVQEISEKLGLQITTARKRLETLEKEGLIAWRAGEPEGRVGRISRRYYLTRKALDLFPRAYGRIACNVLDIVRKRYGEEELEAVLQERR